MASKSKIKAVKVIKNDTRSRQMRLYRIIFGIVAVIVILSMAISSIANF